MRLTESLPSSLICLLAAAVACCGSTTDSKENDHESEVSVAASQPGTNRGQVRDDNSLTMEFVWCPPGSFTMGSPVSEPDRDEDEKQVNVNLKNGFWLGKCEVTQSEWKQLMSTEPWKGKALTKDGDRFPATHVDWDAAMKFCHQLTEQESKAGRLQPNWEYTLPTVAQWEYACRAGSTTIYSFGDDETLIGEYAWFRENADKPGEEHAHLVELKLPNAWGLHDMHGNVWEWCRDWYGTLPGGNDPEVTKATRDSFLDAEYGREIRGGDWRHAAKLCRSARRNLRKPSSAFDYLGFRVALSLTGKK